MTKQSYGPPSNKIKNSRGPSRDNPVSMYHTSYISTFNAGVLEKGPSNRAYSVPVVKRPTGYNANFRPCIYYTPGLDDYDNPALKLKVSTHYETANKKDFKPYKISPTGKEMFLKQGDIVSSASGFTTMRNRAFIHKNSKDIKDAYKIRKYPNQSKNGKAINCQRNTKDPISNENNYTGPEPMSTECAVNYKGQQGRWPSQSWRFQKSVGAKEPTANTRLEPFDPIEYNTRNPYRSDNRTSNYFNKHNRPIGQSEQKTRFVQYNLHQTQLTRNCQTADGIPEPTPMSMRDNAYSRDRTKPRYCDFENSVTSCDDSYLNTNRPDCYKCTLNRFSFTAPGIKNTKVGDGTGRRHVGDKETSGYVKNHPSYNITEDNNPSRFVTHYYKVFTKHQSGNKDKAYNQATLALGARGWPVCKRENGFTKSTRVHAH